MPIIRALVPLLVLLLTGCAATSLRCPGEPLSAQQIDLIRRAQAARDLNIAVRADARAAAYINRCARFDPVTKELVLP